MLDLFINIVGELFFIKKNKKYVITIMLVIFILVYYVGGFINTYLKVKKTKTEMNQLIVELKTYHEINEVYPEDLSFIINKKPINKKFEKDAWLSKYYYNRDNYKLISTGEDKLINTDDDLIKCFKN